MSKKKAVLSVISANLYIPLLAATFWGGWYSDSVVFFIAIVHMIFFTVAIKKWWHHLLLSLNIVLSYCGGVAIATWLFYNFISNDDVTPAVGGAIMLFNADILLLLLAFSILVRLVMALIGKIKAQNSEARE